ncbi:hypothetical protein N9737_02795 [Polaribacter sp.]|nr:hypothetical protein [Polaribacter sp.]
MSQLLKKNHVEIQMDLPSENYCLSRFDWTGKITALQYKGLFITGSENHQGDPENILGKGFYNEFGIETPLGFTETPIGGWFHKIGVGLLKKEEAVYQPGKKYQIKPATFKVTQGAHRIFIRCTSESINGYSYVLEKNIVLLENGFRIDYKLQNTGTKKIITDEYVHNFMAIDKDPIGNNYCLQFPFQLKPAQFIETVNPEKKVLLGATKITFKEAINETFFFSNLSGAKTATAQWELENRKNKLRIRETGNFETNKVNLWGTKQVISPELFFTIDLATNTSVAWSRKFEILETK